MLTGFITVPVVWKLYGSLPQAYCLMTPMETSLMDSLQRCYATAAPLMLLPSSCTLGPGDGRMPSMFIEV